MAIYSDADFIRTWHECGGSPKLVSDALGMDISSVYKRRRSLESRKDTRLQTVPLHNGPTKYSAENYRASIPADKVRTVIDMKDGQIVVGSDAHYWPGIISPAHKAFVAVIHHLKPDITVMNGDAFDGAKISRHGRIGWDQRPSVKEEFSAVSERMDETYNAHPGSLHLWNMGNHDFRPDTFLATHANDFEGVQGFALQDHFPQWKIGMSIMVNEICQIKHRQHNGIHAVYNNTLKSGVTMVTGHLHSLKVTPWTDLTGTRYGVDTGCLADPWGPQFDYQEDGSRNHRAGFAVLTFRNGKLMPPDLCHIIDEDYAWFQGKAFKLTKHG